MPSYIWWVPFLLQCFSISRVSDDPRPADSTTTTQDADKRTLMLSASPGREMLASHVARRTLNVCFGECTALTVAGEPIWSQGTILVLIEYFLFVLLSLSGGFMIPKNISICGYLELLPNWVAFLYFHVAAAGIDSTLWHSVMSVKKETYVPLATTQMLLGVGCAGTLFGFSVFPRCLWQLHQGCVLWWVYVTSASMALKFFRDYAKVNYTAAPVFLWLLGVVMCNLLYFESSFRFYTAESLTIIAYIAWCSSLHHFHGRKFSTFRVFLVNGLEAGVMLSLYRYNQHKVCKTSGSW